MNPSSTDITDSTVFPGALPRPPQNTPAFSSFSDRMQKQMHIKNRKYTAPVSNSEQDEVMVDLKKALDGLVISPGGKTSGFPKRSRLEALARLREERIGLQITQLERKSVAETEFDAALQAFYKRRAEVIAAPGERLNLTDEPIREFWPTVFGLSAPAPVSDVDLPALAHLKDVRVAYLSPSVPGIRAALLAKEPVRGADLPGYRLSLEFAANPFFANSVLQLKVRFDEEDPLAAQWAAASEIEWKPGNGVSARFADLAAAEDAEEIPSLFFLLDLLKEPRDTAEDSPDAPLAPFAVEKAVQFVNMIRKRVLPDAVLIYNGELAAEDADEEFSDWQ
eukprot:gnl/Chilomastix_cuspidata/538.p2 GENE.gnl/Chilomastix_cuspidata/538~~gnl/Chilomastix_cuspidata/538.p2  ORF type:complete len:336 (-),score=201.27 gnl/Chilomastix_cuspidata/538:22-1029(-)